jgi:phosphoglycolate phosphatase
MRTAVFDLDGTLADTSRDLIEAANAALGAPLLDPDRDRLTAFGGGRAMLRLGLSRRGAPVEEGQVECLFPVFLDLYEAGIDRHSHLYPGVVPALDSLAAAGWRLAVCTNKPERLAAILLDRLGISGRFAALVGADTLPQRKPDPRPLLLAVSRAGGDPDQALLVGDSRTDFDTARAAGIPVVLVGFGPDRDAMAALGPDAMIDDFAGLPDLLDSMIPRYAQDFP